MGMTKLYMGGCWIAYVLYNIHVDCSARIQCSGAHNTHFVIVVAHRAQTTFRTGALVRLLLSDETMDAI